MPDKTGNVGLLNDTLGLVPHCGIGGVLATNDFVQIVSTVWSLIVEFISWESTKNFGNSAFTTSLVGALAGAFAGAVAAQRIAERSKKREELLCEIRNTNAAVAVAFGVCNSVLALKKQYVKDLKERFDAQKAEVLEFRGKLTTGEIQDNIIFEFQADLQTLQSQSHPTDILRTLVFERLSIVGRPLNLVMAITQAVENLDESLEKRNGLIEKYKNDFKLDNQGLVPLYFGFPYGNGHVNLDYPSTIEAIYSQTDDCIFFSHLLCKDLCVHGKQLADEFKKKFKKDSPRINEVDFSTTVAAGLMPDEKIYADWTKAFIKKD